MATSMLALFSLFLMVMGAVCITMSLSKSVSFFLKPATICFVLSGKTQTVTSFHFHETLTKNLQLLYNITA